jgi:hypothetical protein
LAGSRHDNIRVGDNGCCNLAFGTGEDDRVGRHRSVEVPDTGARDLVADLKRRSGDVLSGIGAAGVHREAGSRRNRPRHKIDDVEVVRGKVEKQPTARDLAVETPSPHPRLQAGP